MKLLFMIFLGLKFKMRMNKRTINLLLEIVKGILYALAGYFGGNACI